MDTELYRGEINTNYKGINSVVSFHFTVKKSIINRIKYWILCKFMPFSIKRWDK